MNAPRVTHAPYRREPYIRVLFPDGVVVDGKAVAWTRDHVLVHWVVDHDQHQEQWVPAQAVTRIPRDESTWQDPYDIL